MLSFAVISGSLLFIGLWELCRARRRREFPALRRRLGNLGFWIVNVLIGGFFALPDSAVREQLTTALGLRVPSWPAADASLSLVAGFLLLDLLYYLVHRLEHAVPYL
jgi:sterol desaturase/sphingolipid hydroxylase (fatty acid hydroxylase superfamily)